MPTRILFVCLGNICRSPTAEAVMKHIVEERGLSAEIEIDSAGTGDWHVGEKADARMRSAGGKRGYVLTSIARQVRQLYDFDDFDYVVAMDEQNYQDLHRLTKSDTQAAKLHRMVSFCREHQLDGVPDPYFGGAAGFDYVIDILEDGCQGLLEHVLADRDPQADS